MAEDSQPPAIHALAHAMNERLGNVGKTHIVFTSRESLPPPFDSAPNHVPIGRLDPRDAILLVGRALGEGNLMPQAKDAGESEAEILSAAYEIEIAGERFAALPSLRPIYDPKAERTRM